MANSVVKLTIDSQEYDAKLKSAGKALNEYFDICKKGDRTFEVLDEGVMEAVQAMGRMETASKSAKGSLSELQKAFTDMSLTYRRFTDEEKASPVGKAMAQSLSELKTRIKDTKKDLADINKEINGGGGLTGALDSLAGKFGMNIQQLAGWGAAIGAAKVALDVAKDAFFASEQNIDDWGRTVESSKMLYEGFLNALNTGDISGYLQNMGNIAQAAREAYNELDRLGTMKTINAPSTSGRQTEITRLQGMLRSGRAVDSLTGGKSYAEDGAVLTKAQKQQVADDLKALLKESRDTAQQEINQATSAINALYKEQATVLGMNTDEFRNGTKNMQEFDKVLEGAKKYREFEQQHTTTVQTTSGTVGAIYTSSVRDKSVNPYEQFKAWRDFKDDGPMYQRLIQEIQKRDQATQQFYGLVNQSYRGINRAEGIRVGGTGSTTTSQTDQQKAQARYDQAQKDYSQALEEAALAVKSGRADTVAAKKKELSAAESLWKAIGDAREIYDSDAFKTAQEDAAKKVVELGGSVNALVEEQKKAQEAARELTAAQKKAAEAYRNMQVAQANNDLKAYNTALKQYQTAQADVTRLGGELPKLEDKKVIYTVEVNDEQLAKLKALPTNDETIKINVEEGDVNLPLVPKDDQTIRFNVEQGKVDLPDIPKDDQTIRFNVEQGKVDLPEVPKTYTVTIEAATQEAAATVDNFVQDMDATKVEIPVNVDQPKPVEVPVTMSYTDNNMSAFLASLKERIAQEDVGSTLYKNLTAQLADANALANLMQTAIKNGIDISQFNPQDLWGKVFGKNPGDYITDAQWQIIQDTINAKLKEMKLDPIKLNFETGGLTNDAKINKDAWKDAASAVQQLGSALNGLEDPAAKVAGTIAQAIATISLSYAKALEMAATTSGPWGWIAFAATGMATMINTISTVKNASHYAQGGIVSGNDFTDSTPVYVSSGELILNKAQQNTLAAELTNRGNDGGGSSTPYVSGEQIFLGLNNYLKRSGRGELITARG